MSTIREHPVIIVYSQGDDITALIGQRLRSVVIEDQPGIGADRVILEIADNGGILFPELGTNCAVRMGWRNEELVYMGSYETSAPARIWNSDGVYLQVVGSAAKWTQKLKAPKIRTWRATTLAAIVQKIAAEHGFTPAVDGALGGLAIAHEQQNESDIHFITRLAETYGGIAKPDNDESGSWFPFAERYEGRAVSRSDLTVILDFKDKHKMLSGRHQKEARISYQAVRAYWLDNDSGENKPVTAGAGEPLYEIVDHLFLNSTEARTAAKTKLKHFQHRHKINFQIQGELKIIAGGKVDIRRLHSEVNGEWIVDGVRHTFGQAGLHTHFKATRAD